MKPSMAAKLAQLTLRREELKFGVEKHHHGSDLRQWLQRVTALIMLAFILFHVITLHRWFGGRFDPANAFSSASHAIWPALALAVPGNIVPDFPLINKSFNLCYACTDK